MRLLHKTVFFFASLTCLSVMLLQAYPMIWLIILWDRACGVSPALHRERMSRLAMRYSGRIIRLFGLLMSCRIEFRLPERLRTRGPAVVIVNHRSTFDILLTLAALGRMGYTKARFVAKREAADVPVIGLAAQEMGCAFISRRGDLADLEAIRECAVGALQDDACMVIFPEGTTFHNPAFVSKRAGEYRHLLPPRASGLKAVLAVLTDRPTLSVTLDWGDIVGADTARGMAPLYGKALIVDGEFVAGPVGESVEQWLNQEWKRKDEKIERMHRGA